VSEAATKEREPRIGGPLVAAGVDGRPRPRRAGELVRTFFSYQAAGPLVALVLAIAVFSVTTDTFLNGQNLSLILQQTVVVGTLAIGQTLIILTSGIDLSIAAIMVIGTVVMGRIALDGNWALALLVGGVVCVALGAVNGLIISRLNLPPFIVTLGALTALTAAAQLFTSSASYPVSAKGLTILGQGIPVGGTTVLSWGVLVWIVVIAVTSYALSRTAWGAHLYAIGNSETAAKLNGVKVSRVLFGVYVLGGVICAIGAWQALGRTPVADPSAYATANLDSITAVVVGGTSLFGGRGGVLGTILGSLIVTVLANGLVLAGISSLYQQVATGILVVAAVLVDQVMRKRRA
jgi:fructose transport system permease protein